MKDPTRRTVTAALGIATLTTTVFGSGVGFALAGDHGDHGDDDGNDNSSDTHEAHSRCSSEAVSARYAAQIAADPTVAQAWAAYQSARAAERAAGRKDSTAKSLVAKAKAHKQRAQDRPTQRKVAEVKKKATEARHKHDQASAAVAVALAAYTRTRVAAIARIIAEVCVVAPAPVATGTPPPPAPVPTGTPPPPAPVVSGTFLGVASKKNPYGNVQVQIVVVNSKITAVTAPKYPTASDSGKINAKAIPILISEALAAQSANIAAVSGASYTSPAFKESLQSSLTLAGL